MPNYNTPTKIYSKSSVVNAANGMSLQIGASGTSTSMDIGLKAPSKGIDHFTNSDGLTSLELTDKERFDTRGATKFLGVEFHPNAIKIEEDIAAIAYDEYTDINKFAIKIDNTGKVGEPMGMYRSGYGQIAYGDTFYKQWETFDDVWALPMLDRSAFDRMGEHTIVGEREASWSDFGDHYFHNMFIIVEYAGTSHGLEYSAANQAKVAALAGKKQVFRYFERRRWNHQERKWITGKLISEKQIPHGHFYWDSAQKVGRDVLKLKIGNKSELAGVPQIPYVEENAPDDVRSVFGEGYKPPINASWWTADYYVTWGRLNIKSIQIAKYTPVVECGKVDIYTRKSGNITGVGDRGKVTAPSHGLKDGDIIKVSSALTPTGTNDLVDHNHEINGTRYVSVIDSDTVRLYKDGDMSETVSTSTSLRPAVPAETFEAVWTVMGNVFSGDSQGWQYYKSMSSPTGRNGYTHRAFGFAWPNVDAEAWPTGSVGEVTDGHFLFDRILDVFNDDNNITQKEMPSLVGGVMNKWDWLFATDLQLVDTLVLNEPNPKDTDDISYSASFYFPGDDKTEGARSNYGVESKINNLEITNGLLAIRNDSQASTLDALWKHPRNFFPHAPCDLSGRLYDTVRKQGSPEFAIQKGYRFGSSIDLKKEKVDGSSNVYKLVIGERGAAKIPNYQNMRPLGIGEVLDDITARKRGQNADKSAIEKKAVDYSRDINIFPKTNSKSEEAESYNKPKLGFEPDIAYHNKLSFADVARDRLWQEGMGRTNGWNMKAVPHGGAYGKAHLFEIKTDQYGRVTDISFKATYNASSFLNAQQSGWAKDPQEFYSNSKGDYTPTKFFTWQDSSGTGLGGTLASLGGRVHFYNSYRNFYAFEGFGTDLGVRTVAAYPTEGVAPTDNTYEKSGIIGSIIGRLDMAYWLQTFNCHWGYEYFNDAYAVSYLRSRDEFLQSNYILEAHHSVGTEVGSIPGHSNNHYFDDLSLPYNIFDEKYNNYYFNVFHNSNVTGYEPINYDNPSYNNTKAQYFYGHRGVIPQDLGPRLPQEFTKKGIKADTGDFGSSVNLDPQTRHNLIWFANRLHDLYPFVDSFGKAVAFDVIDGEIVISASCKAKAFSEVNDVVAWERENAKTTATGDYKDFLSRLFYIQPSYMADGGATYKADGTPLGHNKSASSRGYDGEYRSNPLGDNPLSRRGVGGGALSMRGIRGGYIIDPDRNIEKLREKLLRADMGYVISGTINSSYAVYKNSRLILSETTSDPEEPSFDTPALTGSVFRAQYYKAEKVGICLIAKDKKLLWGQSHAPLLYEWDRGQIPSTLPRADVERTSYIFIHSDSSYSTVTKIDHYNYLENVFYNNVNSAPVDKKECLLRDINVNPARMYSVYSTKQGDTRDATDKNIKYKLGRYGALPPPGNPPLSSDGGISQMRSFLVIARDPTIRGKDWSTFSSDRFGDNFQYNDGVIVANGYDIRNELGQAHEDVTYSVTSVSDVNVLVDYLHVYESENNRWKSVSKISASIDSEDSNYSYRDVLDVKAGDSLRNLGNINYNNGIMGSKTWDIDLTHRFVTVDDKIILKDPSGYSIFKKRYDDEEEDLQITSSTVCSPYLSFEEKFDCPTQDRDKNNKPLTTPTPLVTYNYENLGFRDNPKLTTYHGPAGQGDSQHTSGISFFKVPIKGNILTAIENLTLTFEYQNFVADVIQSQGQTPAVPLVVLYKYDPRETIYPYYLKYPQNNPEDTRWLTQSFRGGAQDSHFYRLNSFMDNSDKFYLVDDTFGQAMFGGANYLAKAFVPTLSVSTGTAVGASAGGGKTKQRFIGTVEISRHDVMNFLTRQDLIKSATRTISETYGDYSIVFDDTNKSTYNSEVAAQEGPSLIIGFLQGNVVTALSGEKTDSENAGKLVVHVTTTDSKVSSWPPEKRGILLRTPYIDSPANDYYYEEISGDNSPLVKIYKDIINPSDYFSNPNKVHASIKATNKKATDNPMADGGKFSFNWDLGKKTITITKEVRGKDEPKLYYIDIGYSLDILMQRRSSLPFIFKTYREAQDYMTYVIESGRATVGGPTKLSNQRGYSQTDFTTSKTQATERYAKLFPPLDGQGGRPKCQWKYAASGAAYAWSKRPSGYSKCPVIRSGSLSGRVTYEKETKTVLGDAENFEQVLKSVLGKIYGQDCVSVYNGYCVDDTSGMNNSDQYVTYFVHFKNGLGGRKVKISASKNMPNWDSRGIMLGTKFIPDPYNSKTGTTDNPSGLSYPNANTLIPFANAKNRNFSTGFFFSSDIMTGGIKGDEWGTASNITGKAGPKIVVVRNGTSVVGGVNRPSCQTDNVFQVGFPVSKEIMKWSPTNEDSNTIENLSPWIRTVVGNHHIEIRHMTTGLVEGNQVLFNTSLATVEGMQEQSWWTAPKAAGGANGMTYLGDIISALIPTARCYSFGGQPGRYGAPFKGNQHDTILRLENYSGEPFLDAISIANLDPQVKADTEVLVEGGKEFSDSVLQVHHNGGFDGAWLGKVDITVEVSPLPGFEDIPSVVTIELPWGYGFSTSSNTNKSGEATSPASISGRKSILCKDNSWAVASEEGGLSAGYGANCSVTDHKWRLILKNKNGTIKKTTDWLEFNISANALANKIKGLAGAKAGAKSGYYVDVVDQSLGWDNKDSNIYGSTQRVFEVRDANEDIETDASIFLDEDLIIEGQVVVPNDERTAYPKASKNAPYVNSRNLDVSYKNDNVSGTPWELVQSVSHLLADDQQMLGTITNVKPVVTMKSVKNVRRYPCTFSKIAEFNYEVSNNKYDRIKTLFQDKTQNLLLQPDKYGGQQYPTSYELFMEGNTSTLVTSQTRDYTVSLTSTLGYSVKANASATDVNLSIDIINVARKLRYTNPVLGIGSSRSASMTDNTFGEIRGTFSNSNQVLSNDTYYTTSPDQAVYSTNLSKSVLEDNKKKWDEGVGIQSVSSLDYQYLRSWDIKKNEFLPLLMISNPTSSGVMDLRTHGIFDASGVMTLKTVAVAAETNATPLRLGAPTANSINDGELFTIKNYHPATFFISEGVEHTRVPRLNSRGKQNGWIQSTLYSYYYYRKPTESELYRISESAGDEYDDELASLISEYNDIRASFRERGISVRWLAWEEGVLSVVKPPYQNELVRELGWSRKILSSQQILEEWGVFDETDPAQYRPPSLITEGFGVSQTTQELLLFSPPPSAVAPLFLHNQYATGDIPLSVSGPISYASGVQLLISPPFPVSGYSTLAMPTPYGVATTPVCDYPNLFMPGVSGVTGSESLFMKVQMPSSGMNLYAKGPKRFGHEQHHLVNMSLLMPPQGPSGWTTLYMPVATGIFSRNIGHYIYGDTVGNRHFRDTVASGTLFTVGPRFFGGAHFKLHTYFGPNKSDNIIDGDEARCVVSYKNEAFDASSLAEPRITNTSTNSLVLKRYNSDFEGLNDGYVPLEEIASNITTYKKGNDYTFYFNNKVNESFHNNDDYFCLGVNSAPGKEGTAIEIFEISIDKQINLVQTYNTLESDLDTASLLSSTRTITEAHYKSIRISDGNRIAASIALKTANSGTLTDVKYENIIFILEKASDADTWAFTAGFGNSCTNTSDRLKKDLGTFIEWDGEELYYSKESALNGEINYISQSNSYATEQTAVSFADTDAFTPYRTNLNSRHLEETKLGFGHKVIIKGDLMFVSCPLLDGFMVKNTLTHYSLNAFRGAVFVFKKSGSTVVSGAPALHTWSYTDTVYQGGYDTSTLAADSYVCKYTVNLFGYDIAYNDRNDILVVGEPATKKVYRYSVNSSGAASFVTEYSGSSDDIDYGASVDVCHFDIITFSKKAVLTEQDTQITTYDSKGHPRINPPRGADARTLSGVIYNLRTGASFNFDINNPYYETIPYVPTGNTFRSVEEKLWHIRLLHFSDNSSALIAGRTFNLQYGLQSNNLIKKLSLLEVANDVYPTLFMQGPLPLTNSLTLQTAPFGSGVGSMSLSLPLRATGQGVNLFLDQRTSSGALDMHIRTATSGVMPLTLTNYPVSGTHTAPLVVKVALPATGGMDLAMPTTLGPLNQGFNFTLYNGPAFQSWPLFLKQRDPIPLADDGLLFLYGHTISCSRDVGETSLSTEGTIWAPAKNTYELFMRGPDKVDVSGNFDFLMYCPPDTGVASDVVTLSIPSATGWANWTNTSQLYILTHEGEPASNMNLMYPQKGIGGGDEIEGKVNIILENKTTNTNISLVSSGIYGLNNSVNLIMTSGDGSTPAARNLYIRGYLE